MATRRITGADRILKYGDDMDRVLYPERKTKPARRRSALALGNDLDVVVIEETNKPTEVYIGEANSSAVVQLSVDQFRKASKFVDEVLSKPPPIKRKR